MKIFQFQYHPPTSQPDDYASFSRYSYNGLIETFVVAPTESDARQLLNAKNKTDVFSDTERWPAFEIDLTVSEVVASVYLD